LSASWTIASAGCWARVRLSPFGLLELCGAHPAGQLGIHPVPRLEQLPDPVELLPRRHAVDVLGGQGIERRLQLAHDTTQPFDQVFEVYR
jgi:hypothetical protein